MLDSDLNKLNVQNFQDTEEQRIPPQEEEPPDQQTRSKDMPIIAESDIEQQSVVCTNSIQNCVRNFIDIVKHQLI